MKETTHLFIDLRGRDLRALVTEGKRVLAASATPGPLDDERTLQDLIATLVAKAGHKPERAHLVLGNDQVSFNTYRLQEMPLADVEMIIQRSITTATGEREPIFRLTPLSPQQDKEAFLAEQVSRETVAGYRQLFEKAGVRLETISTGLQANLAAFAAHRDDILQAQAIFDISSEAITAIFLSPTELLHYETLAIQEVEREDDSSDAAERSRAIKRRLFAILNVIHGIYSQYMLANPHSAIEKVWLCGPESGIEGLEESLVEAMDVEAAAFDLLAGQLDDSRPYTPLFGLAEARGQAGFVNFIPAETRKPTRAVSRTRALAAGAVVVLLLAAVVVTSQLEIRRMEQRLKSETAELQFLQATAAAERDRAASLRFLKQLDDTTPALYAMLGEVADRLPVEVQLDGINYRQEDDSGVLELLAVTRHETPWKNERIFTALMASLDESPTLECKQDPEIAMLRVGEEKLIKIKVSCRTRTPERKP